MMAEVHQYEAEDPLPAQEDAEASPGEALVPAPKKEKLCQLFRCVCSPDLADSVSSFQPCQQNPWTTPAWRRLTSSACIEKVCKSANFGPTWQAINTLKDKNTHRRKHS
ncbi:unnamed protein product [Symbiodinium natans]|uniref:Uncharacterized protein n=1 Tax=Symbiodinium natans TaxID=878477 RepID=A0A812QSV8_9DINO|nr:unnamed protein product [Symbiodinium natans]